MQVPVATNPTTDQMTLVFRQWCDSDKHSLKKYSYSEFKTSRNEHFPGSDEYSILTQLENMKYKNPDGTEVYKFRLEYNGNGMNAHWCEWTQTNNPMTSDEPGTVENVKIYDGYDNLRSKFANFKGLHRDGETALLKGPGNGIGGPNFEIGSFDNLPNCPHCVVYPHQDQSWSRESTGLSLYAITNKAKQLEQKIQDTTQSQETMRTFVIYQYQNELQQLQQQKRESTERLNQYRTTIQDNKEEQAHYIQTRIDDGVTDDQIIEALGRSSSNSVPFALRSDFRNVLSEINVTTFRAQMNGIFASEDDAAKTELAKFLLTHSRDNARWKVLSNGLARAETELAIELENQAKIDALISLSQSKMNDFSKLTR
jgi:transcription termination factor NusB